MSELNFFHVKIGQTTKRGHFNEHHSFVCKAKMTEYELATFMRKKYTGLEVQVYNIDQVVDFSNVENKVKKDQIKESVTEQRVYKGYISLWEEKELYEDHKQKEGFAENARVCLMDACRKLLAKRFKGFVFDIDLGRYHGGQLNYICKLKGSIFENFISNKDTKNNKS